MKPLPGHWVNVVVFGLKIVALVTLLQPILARPVSKAITVFVPAWPGMLGLSVQQRSYTYYRGFHLLTFSDVKWSLIEGLAVYAVALTIQLAAARLLSSGRIAQNRAMP